MTGLSITIGSALAPVLEAAVKRITAIVLKVRAWTEEHPQLTKFIAIAATAIGVLMLVLGPLLIMLPMIAAGMALVAGASGIGLVILAITAVTAGAILLWKNWETVWNAIKQATETAVNFIIGLFNKMSLVHREALAAMIIGAKAVIDLLPGMGELSKGMQAAIDKLREGIPEIDITAEKVEELGGGGQRVGGCG